MTEFAPAHCNNELLYRQCARRGIRFASAMLKNKCDAEEAVQETFLRMHKSAECETESEYQGRFFKTLRNHCIDRLRKVKVRREQRVVEEGLIEEHYCKLTENELSLFVQNTIDQLPQDWSQALLLKTHGQLSYKEIATATQSSPTQVRTWIYRARRELEKKLVAAGFLGSQSLR